MKKKLYGNHIEPACAYCARGTVSKDGQMILCDKRGIVAQDFRCRKFVYDPLRRVPKQAPILPDFDEKDFELS